MPDALCLVCPAPLRLRRGRPLKPDGWRLVSVSDSEGDIQQSVGGGGANDDAQGHVNAYFDSNASYWDGVYRGDDLQGLIYRGRQEVVSAYIDAAGLGPTARVLEIGCGAGHLTVDLAHRQLRVEAVDASNAMVEATAARVLEAGFKEQVTVQKADVHALPFATSHFDLVVAIGVIPWLHSPPDAVAEMTRVLRPGGQLVVTADNRARLTSFTDPRSILAMTPLKRVYRAIRKHDPTAVSHLHSPRRLDRMLVQAGLRPLARRTVGFGPFSFMGRYLEGSVAMRLNAWLQGLADRGVRGVRSTGWHYIVRAEKLYGAHDSPGAR